MICHYAHEKHKMDCHIYEELDFEIEIQNPNISKNSKTKQPLLWLLLLIKFIYDPLT